MRIYAIPTQDRMNYSAVMETDSSSFTKVLAAGTYTERNGAISFNGQYLHIGGLIKSESDSVVEYLGVEILLIIRKVYDGGLYLV